MTAISLAALMSHHGPATNEKQVAEADMPASFPKGAASYVLVSSGWLMFECRKLQVREDDETDVYIRSSPYSMFTGQRSSSLQQR